MKRVYRWKMDGISPEGNKWQSNQVHFMDSKEKALAQLGKEVIRMTLAGHAIISARIEERQVF